MTRTEPIRFEASLLTLRDQIILRLPEDASAKLPSRGQVAVHGTVNGHALRTVLEPDGDRGHWMRIDPEVQQAIGIGPGGCATLILELTEDWPEPDVPGDLTAALSAAPQAVQDKWKDITPMARWEWVRWINETRNANTRAIRIEKTISKLSGKHRRPCCFNLSACTDPELSRSGRLMDPAQAERS